MITKAIRLEIQQMQESGIQERADELHNWLYGEKKEIFSEVLVYVGLQGDLIANLTRELADLRKEETQVENKFFSMATTAKPRK
ncbi:hypothetical protein D3C87_1792460 [compost metagenome]